MLDFHPRVQPRNYLSRREQRRLFGWVMGIGLIVIACASFVDFRQIARMQPAQRAGSIDTRFEPRPRYSGEPDAVRIVKADEPAPASEDAGLLVGMNAELLGRVHDDTPWIRSDEVDAWLNVWSALRRSNDDELARRSAGNVGFVELFQQARAFRGRVVTLRGSARQAEYVPAAENAAEIAGYYRVIIRPEDGPPEPVFLYTLELPHGFPTGDNLRADVQATGVFFKRMVYPTREAAELRRAPVIMARTLSWLQPAAPADSRGGSFIGVLVVLAALGVVGLILTAYWAAGRRVLVGKRRPSTLPPIDDRDVVNVEESLSKLRESDR